MWSCREALSRRFLQKLPGTVVARSLELVVLLGSCAQVTQLAAKGFCTIDPRLDEEMLRQAREDMRDVCQLPLEKRQQALQHFHSAAGYFGAGSDVQDINDLDAQGILRQPPAMATWLKILGEIICAFPTPCIT